MEACYSAECASSRASQVFIAAAPRRRVDGERELRRMLVDEVRELKEAHGYADLGRAFQHWVAVYVLGLTNYGDIAHEIKGNQSRDGGVDYFVVDEDARKVEILQAKFSERLDKKASEGDLSLLFETPSKLLNSRRGSRAFRGYQKQYRDAVDRGFATRLVFVVAGELSPSARELADSKADGLPPDTEFGCYGIEDLLVQIGRVPSPKRELAIVPGELFVSESRDDRKLVATVPVAELVRAYKDIKPAVLFSLNPRESLKPNNISRRITDTIENSPGRLWHYNNGISAVCDSFEIRPDGGSLVIHNFKIVNGCQTITAASNCKGPISPEATLMLRLSKVNDDGFRAEISRNTNAQNRIDANDLSSDHPYLRVLSEAFRRGYPGFFWERKRGMYNSLPEEAKNHGSESRKLRVFDSVTAAKLKLAFKLNSPHLSTKLPKSKIYSNAPVNDFEPFDSIFKDADPKDFIVPQVLFYLLGKVAGEPEPRVNSLLRIDVGKYYVLALIGRKLRQMEKGCEIVDKIIRTAEECDEEAAGRLQSKLREFVASTLPSLEEVLDPENREPLDRYDKTSLKERLERGVFDDWYDKRQRMLETAMAGDPLERMLLDFLTGGETR